jgi:serine/threonine-protein kinase RsbW
VRIAADPAEVPRLLDLLEDYAGKADLAPRAANRLAVVCEELAANVARHGAAGSGGASYVAVALRRRGPGLHVLVEDDGPPFDPLGRAAPDTDAPLDTRQAGGLGVHLVRTLARDLSYARSGPLNRLRFMIDLGD